MEVETCPELRPECLYLGATRYYNLKKKNPDEYDLRLRHMLYFSREEASAAKQGELDRAAAEVGFTNQRAYARFWKDDAMQEFRVSHSYSGGCLTFEITHLWTGLVIKALKIPKTEKLIEAKPASASSEDLDIHSEEEMGEDEESEEEEDSEESEPSVVRAVEESVKPIVFRTKAQAQEVRDAVKAFKQCNSKFGLPKDVVDIITQYIIRFWHKCAMSHIQASPIVSGTRVYLITTRMFVATYDCVDVEWHMLCLGDLNDAIKLCKVRFFEEVDRVWRGGYQSVLSDWSGGKKKTERLKWESVSDVDDWKTRDFRAKWDGDDNAGKYAIDGPAIATVTEFVLTFNGKWNCSEGQVVFRLPAPERSAKKVKTNS